MAARRRQTAGQEALFEPDPPLTRRTRSTTDRTIRELRAQRRLEAEQAGLVGMLRTLADLIDDELGELEPNKWTVARLASEWRAVHAELRGQADSWDQQIAAFFDDAPAVHDPAP
jgi:hypothetical protein